MISVQNLKNIASKLPLNLTTKSSFFKSRFKDGEHELVLFIQDDGMESVEVFAKGWNDYTEDAKLLNELLGLEKK